jgi:hypothetical protein
MVDSPRRDSDPGTRASLDRPGESRKNGRFASAWTLSALTLISGRKGQALHGPVDADAASQSEIGSLSDLQFVVHADSKASEKTAASAGPCQGDLSRS